VLQVGFPGWLLATQPELLGLTYFKYNIWLEQRSSLMWTVCCLIFQSEA